MHTFDQAIEVLKAAKEGKQIEWSYIDTSEWQTLADKDSITSYNFAMWEYRVKPAPRLVYGVLDTLDTTGSYSGLHLYKDKIQAQHYASSCNEKSIDKKRYVVLTFKEQTPNE